MFVVHLCMYLCVYLSQAVSFPPTLGIEWDLYWHVHLAEEDQFEPVVKASSDVAPLFLAESLRSGHVRGSKTLPVLGKIARNRHLLPSEMRFGCGNPANQKVRALASYL